jgi:hypothetical protein
VSGTGGGRGRRGGESQGGGRPGRAGWPPAARFFAPPPAGQLVLTAAVAAFCAFVACGRGPARRYALLLAGSAMAPSKCTSTAPIAWPWAAEGASCLLLPCPPIRQSCCMLRFPGRPSSELPRDSGPWRAHVGVGLSREREGSGKEGGGRALHQAVDGHAATQSAADRLRAL